MVLLETTVHQIPTCVVAMVINRTEKILEPSSNQWMKFFIGLDMAHGSKVSNISLNLESLNILTFQASKATRGLLHSFVLGWFYSASYFLAKIFKMFGASLAHEQHRTSHRLDLPHDVGDAGFHMTVGTTAFCGAGDVIQSKSIRGLCWSWTAYEVPDGDIKSSIGYTELMLRWEIWANTSFSTIYDCGNKDRDMDKNGWGKVRWVRRESLGLSLEWLPKLMSQLKVMSPQQKQRQWAETLKRIRSGCVKKEKKGFHSHAHFSSRITLKKGI